MNVGSSKFLSPPRRDDIHVLNVANEVQDGWSWETHTVKGAIVKPRTGHAAQLVKGHLYIHGGWSQNMFLDDVVKVEVRVRGAYVYSAVAVLHTAGYAGRCAKK